MFGTLSLLIFYGVSFRGESEVMLYVEHSYKSVQACTYFEYFYERTRAEWLGNIAEIQTNPQEPRLGVA